MDDRNREILAAAREERLRRYDEAMRENGTNHLTAQAINACTFCDSDGYRPTGVVCDHVDRAAIAKAGSARCREMLKKGSR